MLSDDQSRWPPLEYAFFQHQFCSAGYLFFARLKQAEDLPMDLLFQPVQHPDGTQQGGHVHIMTAGMHHSLVP